MFHNTPGLKGDTFEIISILWAIDLLAINISFANMVERNTEGHFGK